jgi:hypothetical protein
VNAAFVIAIAGVLVQAGVMLATVKFLSEKQDDQHGHTQKDLNGLGRKGRSMMAEQIIQAAIIAGLPKDERQDFAVLVRKLINGI